MPKEVLEPGYAVDDGGGDGGDGGEAPGTASGEASSGLAMRRPPKACERLRSPFMAAIDVIDGSAMGGPMAIPRSLAGGSSGMMERASRREC
jgi:hypothetical protein